MTSSNNNGVSEAQIRQLIETRVQAIRAKDVEASMAAAAPDVVVFDVVNPLRYTGAAAVRKRTAEWFSSFLGPIGYEIRELTIAAGDDTAFSHSLNQVRATRTDGQKLEMWWRATAGYRKIDGKWRITHEHSSAPFDPANGKASLVSSHRRI